MSDYFFVYNPKCQKAIVCWYEDSRFYFEQAIVAASSPSYITVSVQSRTMIVGLHIIQEKFFGETILGSLEQYPSQTILYADPDSEIRQVNQLLVVVLPVIIAQKQISFSESSLDDFLAHFPMTILGETVVPLALLFLLDNAWQKEPLPPVAIRSAFSSVPSSASNSPVIASGSPASGSTIVVDDDELEGEFFVGDNGDKGDKVVRPGAPGIDARRNSSASSW